MAAPSADKLLSARAALAAVDPALAAADAAAPPFAWRAQAKGYAGLSRMILSQQLSTASANAIWGRFEAGLGQVTPQAVLAADEAVLRSFGLSSQKVRYVRAIAEAHLSGAPDFDTLPDLADEAAIAALTAIKGVGRWTAELYLLFAEVRLDAFPAGDLALQEGLRLAEGAPKRLNEKQLYARAEVWRPYRGVAAHLLWAYYSQAKRGALATLEEKP
ncbi:MAG TPA: DNA-3-methyladenine glycosylase 2 family protein [Caulobacteraceae bacterium]|jgi:DNA-3-methyladenine glycosylase II|nr:DNA-3-methyladenine glycosylase 2 family protein [Caulobacteraceae bacterium]